MSLDRIRESLDKGTIHERKQQRNYLQGNWLQQKHRSSINEGVAGEDRC
jgi:hypothetical protein